MKFLLAPAVALIAIGAGGGAAYILTAPAADGADPAAMESDAVAKADGDDYGDDAKAAKKADSGQSGDKSDGKKSAKGGDSYGADDSIFYKFSREFVVPILADGKVASLVILNINIEADPEISGDLFRQDPKLRDNIMTTLVELSGDQQIFGEFTDVETYETVRSVILMNVKEVIPHGIRNILIVDMAKQDLA